MGIRWDCGSFGPAGLFTMPEMSAMTTLRIVALTVDNGVRLHIYYISELRPACSVLDGGQGPPRLSGDRRGGERQEVDRP